MDRAISISAVDISEATTQDDMRSVRALFVEYAASLNFSLCFQNFEKEMAELPGEYSPPGGSLLLISEDGDIAGCVGLRRLTDEVCEMKRLYVRPAFRGRGLGNELVRVVIDGARSAGYLKMRMDTLPGVMDRAISIYRSVGFKEIEPYYFNPVEGALFLELLLLDLDMQSRR